MNFILAVCMMALTAWNVHDGWWGWATWTGFIALYFVVNEAFTSAIETILHNMMKNFEIRSLPLDFPMEFPPKVKKDEEN